MSTEDEPPPRYSDPGERISLTDLEEIKPLGSTPPPVPNEVAEHFDLDEAMKGALASVAAPPAPTINVDAPPRAEKRSSSSKKLRPLQAVIAIGVGAALAWFVQPGDDAPATVAETTESSAAIARAEPTEAEPASIPEIAAVEPRSSVPQTGVGANTPEEPDEPIVAQRPEETEDAEEARDERETREEHEERETREEHEERETRQDAADTEPSSDENDNPHLPADYHTPEAQAEREARRAERRAAEEAAAAAAEAAEAAEAERAELPPHPDREAVREAMEGVRAAITECAGGRHGTATLRITVHHSGRVQGSIVEGHFSGTPEGSCMALAARRARFPRFSEDRFSVTYPFTF